MLMRPEEQRHAPLCKRAAGQSPGLTWLALRCAYVHPNQNQNQSSQSQSTYPAPWRPSLLYSLSLLLNFPLAGRVQARVFKRPLPHVRCRILHVHGQLDLNGASLCMGSCRGRDRTALLRFVHYCRTGSIELHRDGPRHFRHFTGPFRAAAATAAAAAAAATHQARARLARVRRARLRRPCAGGACP